MKKEFHYKSKERILESTAIAFWIWLFIFVFATIFFIFQILLLEPEPGSTYQQDMIKATLCYIFIPLGMGCVIFLACFLALSTIYYETKIEDNLVTITIRNKANITPVDFVYSFELSDIISIKPSFLFKIVGKKDIVVKVKKYTENGAPLHGKRRFCLCRVCTKEERKQFIEKYNKIKKESIRKEKEKNFYE